MKFFAAAAIGLMMLSGAARAGNVEGTWQSHDGMLKVRLSDCGSTLCGKVVWLGEPIDRATGKPKTDKRNPDPAKRARPLIGLTVVKSLKPTGPNEWSGLIYNADDGNTYQAHLKVTNARTVRLQGCVLGVLCKANTWMRAD
jgi:uncharacterized protein (DUF2147 family)